jgi:hypothetical protein
MIQKIYQVDPLLCLLKRQGTMKIISFIEELAVIRKILVHLNLWETRNHDPSPKQPVRIQELMYGDACSQLPFSDDWAQYLILAHTGQVPSKSVKKR